MAVRDVRGKTVRCTLFEAPAPGVVTCLRDALVAIDPAGMIATVTAVDSPDYDRRYREAQAAGVLVALSGALLPGLVDLHVHAPQYPQLGKALDAPLEVWLGRYTFPLEARYRDLEFAAPRYRALVEDLLANGTTTALYFATIDLAATKLLADICAAQRQRAFVGKVAMDDVALCPPDYRDASAHAAVAETRELIDYVARLAGAARLIEAVVTPRFTPACTDELLAGLGSLAAVTGCTVQTHCSESDWAHGHARARFGRSDVEALDGFGLVGRRSVLAHANFITASDMETLAARGASVAHCPYSNIYFANAVFPLRAALAKGLRVGLGTDIAGGPSASMFDSMRYAVAASRTLESGVDPNVPAQRRGRPGSQIDIATALYLATAAGGEALDVRIGRLAPGYHFDALLIDPEAPDGTIRLWDEGDDLLVLQTILLTASRANIAAVWTNGMRVGSETSVA